jgi:hypothetical protein
MAIHISGMHRIAATINFNRTDRISLRVHASNSSTRVGASGL